MKIETYEQRVLIPETGFWLYNAAEKVISDKVFLGKQAVADEWVEITDADKNRLEVQWQQEEETEAG